jgi:hypothetical protein
MLFKIFCLPVSSLKARRSKYTKLILPVVLCGNLVSHSKGTTLIYGASEQGAEGNVWS